MKSRVLKTLGVVLATVACIGMTTFAADEYTSPSASTPAGDASAVTDNNGSEVEVTISTNFDAAHQAAVDAIKTASGFDAVVKSLNLTSVLNTAAENISLVDVKEVSVPEGTKFPITITFSVSGITANSKATLLHYDGTAWENIKTTVGEGTLTGTFDSLSPVAFVVDKTTVGTTSNGATSPKTSAAAPAAAGVVALLAAAAVVGLKKNAVVK